jgi:hypothetical protein
MGLRQWWSRDLILENKQWVVQNWRLNANVLCLSWVIEPHKPSFFCVFWVMPWFYWMCRSCWTGLHGGYIDRSTSGSQLLMHSTRSFKSFNGICSTHLKLGQFGSTLSLRRLDVTLDLVEFDIHLLALLDRTHRWKDTTNCNLTSDLTRSP